ncbi:MAG: ATP phosphoribosyltransferase [Thermaurantimonas sp.]|uniref:ATP phosphoribosyltransferase n=1 Tax=Thermaurantimonas sp. TaxID=2681568 RepID=UPI00391C3430
MTKLKIALQKSGRLSDKSAELLREAGIHFPNDGSKLRTEASNFPLEIYLLRDDDIPQYVADGVADAGIVGLNVVAEKSKDIRVVDHLGFGKCRLSVAVPKNQPFDSLQDLNGKRIATSYTRIVSRYLHEHGIEAEIHEISGSVEIAPGIGLADAICDLVSTGSTLLTNGLREVATVMHSEAVLVARPDLSSIQAEVLSKLIFRLQAVRKARNHKYILLNAPNERIPDIARVLPGMKSPTILPLATEGWSSLHSVVEEDTFWEVIEQLKDLGAQGILVVPIEKMIV